MKAMILSAGLGTRLMPLTAEQPKPLVKVGNKSLLERNILHLYKHGVKEMVVNGSIFGEQIEALIDAIELPGLKIFFIDEGIEPLGTAGAIFNAQEEGYFLEEDFWVINSDVLSNYSFPAIEFTKNTLGHLILVPNPEHNILGDFCIRSSRVTSESNDRYTCLLYTSPSPRDGLLSRMPSSA